jgi:hypothetical protein
MTDDGPLRRRTGTELEGALLDAAWEELQVLGYAGLTYDGVAARARLAAMQHAGLFERQALPDTGSLRGDIVTSLRNFNEVRADFITAIGLYLANIASDSGLSPAVLRERLLGDRRSSASVFLERAAQRGEIPARAWPPGLVTMPIDLFRHDLVMTLARVPDARIVEIVDELWLPLLGRGG